MTAADPLSSAPPWLALAPELALEDLAPADRAALADHWTREALAEHASVASFARTSLVWIALGAPPELLAAAHEAAVDEVRHARVSFRLASAFAGEGRGPGPLPLADMAPADLSPVDAALETFLDGCVNETVAALVAREGAARATAAPVREALEAIAADEERHAELAWRSLAWLVRGWPESVAPVIARALADLLLGARVPKGVAPSSPRAELLARYGVVSPARQAEIHRATVVEVVAPCARAILATTSR